MAPTLVASYFVNSSGQTAAAISTPSFTPSNGEVIVVTMETWDTGTSLGSLSGGGQTYTSQVTVAPGGFRPWVGISTAVISGSPGSMTVSATPSASARFSMTVERWSGAQLAASPAVGSGNGGTGAANGSLTTAAANSIVSWVAGDAQSLDPSTRAYLSSATDEGVRDDHVGSNGVGYHGYQLAAAAGSQSFGLSAPTGMQWCIAGIEVQDAAGSAPVIGQQSTSRHPGRGPGLTRFYQTPRSTDLQSTVTPVTLTDTGSGDDSTFSVSATVPLADSGSAVDTLAVSATVPVADAGGATDALAETVTAALTDTGAASDAIVVSATVPLADSGSASDSISVNTGATPVTLTDTGSASDAITVAVTAPLADAATASDALANTATIHVADTAAAADTANVVATLALAEAASALDSLTVVGTIHLADTAAGADSLSVNTSGVLNKALTDSGSAADSLCVETLRPDTGITTRPSTGTTAYALATTARSSTGTTTRPNTGTTDPC